MLDAFLSVLFASSLHAPSTEWRALEREDYEETRPRLVAETQTMPGENEGPVVSAEAVIAIELDATDPTYGQILYEKNSRQQRPIASITKLMTGLIIAEEETRHTVVEVSESASRQEGSTIWLNNGEKITIEDLMYGMMMASGNDAATALAEYNAGSVEQFVRKMNQRAEQIGLTSTHYSNPVGFDSAQNYSTPQDIAMLSMIAMENEFLMEPVGLSTYEIESESGIVHEYISTNKLLEQDIGIEGLSVEGLKTGRTPQAQECLVNLARYDNGRQIMTVVLGSENRFQDTQNLLHWIDTHHPS